MDRYATLRVDVPLYPARLPDEDRSRPRMPAARFRDALGQGRNGVLSTTETTVVTLSFGREDLLPRSYPKFRDAQRMLDVRRRQEVYIAAGWPGPRGAKKAVP